ncbi:unnamed protein product [Penicillium salamii]|uniref:J domain-containing protein n=1 Tax=Penicillium salamii TaxID=1612424 RepID=A0A9W4J308_9EURO|nr:unnamed protein product [Penicillium salamii]
MFKKPNYLRGGSLQLLNLNLKVPLPLSRATLSQTHRPQGTYTSRFYATASQFSHQDDSWPSNSSFTPYDVLNIPRGARYSKRNYYDLVKIYHPDRPLKDHPLFHQLTPEIRLQRYRIVVDAHELLSDPNKRASYDRTGAGWVHTVPDTKVDWQTPGPSVYANATWEDWERWHNRHHAPQQHVVDQRTFVRLLILLVLFGGALQASWIGKLHTEVDDRLRELNEDSARFLRGRKEDTVKQMNSNEARVQGFLIRRDPTGAGLKDAEQAVYEKELNPRLGLDKTQTDNQEGPISGPSGEDMLGSTELPEN